MSRPPGVEFLDGPDDRGLGPDDASTPTSGEELPQPQQRSDTRRSWPVAALVAAAAAALIARGIVGGGSDPSADRSATRTVTSTSGPTAVPRPADCPGQSVCEVARNLPTTTLDSIRVALPHAALVSAASVIVDSGVHFGSPLIRRNATLTVGTGAAATSLAFSIKQVSCAGTQPGSRVTRQLLRDATLTQYDRVVAGDVEGNGRTDTAFCFAVSMSVRQPPKTSLVSNTTLDRLAVDPALQSAG